MLCFRILFYRVSMDVCCETVKYLQFFLVLVKHNWFQYIQYFLMDLESRIKLFNHYKSSFLR